MLWNVLFIFAGVGAYFGVDSYFTARLLPLPAWPYGVSSALFIFSALKFIQAWIRLRRFS